MNLPYNKNWTKLWWGAGYQSKKQAGFDALDAYLPSAPRTILDIGCGLAWESRKFNQKYGSELWLLDGDVKVNDSKDIPGASFGKWNPDANTMLFYHSLDFLQEELSTAGISNYHLVDVNNISIPSGMKFDLITSWLSCGFHYPVSTYRNLILQHSHADTVVAMDLRMTKQSVNGLPPVENGVQIVKTIHRGKKHWLTHIRFV